MSRSACRRRRPQGQWRRCWATASALVFGRSNGGTQEERGGRTRGRETRDSCWLHHDQQMIHRQPPLRCQTNRQHGRQSRGAWVPTRQTSVRLRRTRNPGRWVSTDVSLSEEGGSRVCQSGRLGLVGGCPTRDQERDQSNQPEEDFRVMAKPSEHEMDTVDEQLGIVVGSGGVGKGHGRGEEKRRVEVRARRHDIVGDANDDVQCLVRNRAGPGAARVRRCQPRDKQLGPMLVISRTPDKVDEFEEPGRVRRMAGVQRASDGTATCSIVSTALSSRASDSSRRGTIASRHLSMNLTRVFSADKNSRISPARERPWAQRHRELWPRSEHPASTATRDSRQRPLRRA